MKWSQILFWKLVGLAFSLIIAVSTLMKPSEQEISDVMNGIMLGTISFSELDADLQREIERRTGPMDWAAVEGILAADLSEAAGPSD